MTPQEVRFWERVNRKASSLSPDIAAAILRAYQILRESMSAGEWERAIESGRIDQLLSERVLDKAFTPLRDRIRNSVVQGAKYFGRDLPKPARPSQTLTFAFDILNPDVITAIRKLETKVIETLQADVRETVRAYVENGLRDGKPVRTIAKSLRSVIGLAPNQELAVRNFRKALEAGDREALTRGLRDRRFDSVLERTLGAKGEGLTAEQVDRFTDAYRRRFIAFNAETNARTASSDAMKLGQRLSIDNAVEQGVYDPDRLVKRWVGVMDERERPEHVELEGETVPYDETFSNGEMMPGDSTFNCRCVAVYTQRAAA